jgi:hypothetical protein
MKPSLIHHSKLVLIALLTIAVLAPCYTGTARARGRQKQRPEFRNQLAASRAVFGSTLTQSEDGSMSCRPATTEEANVIAQRDPQQQLNVITPVQVNQTGQSGLHIVLRATPELDANPAAKAIFVKSAALWESWITTPITVVVDVDFGPQWFGLDYTQGAVGFTTPQMLSAEGAYHALLENYLDFPDTPDEFSVYAKLPQQTVPTDLGDTNVVIGTSAWFRAIGFIDSVADPSTEPASWGRAPAIGFNSAASYDFDPSDGIDTGKIDFDAEVTHELGHVLGFMSYEGQRELNPDCELAVTAWDLFRIRSNVGWENFPTAQRILTSGGAQSYFDGNNRWGLSTGKPDGTGGDGRPPSHWQDDAISGTRIGIMDPTTPAGRRQTITLRDLKALDLFGYSIKSIGSNPPSLTKLTGDLNGDVLTLTGIETDPDGDVVQAQLTTLDEKGHVLGTSNPFDIDFGVPFVLTFKVDVSGLNQSPAALQAGLVVIDTRGNKSAMRIADFSAGDSGGPKLKSAVYRNGTLTIKGKKMTDQLGVEINGVVITPASGFDSSSAGKRVSVEAPSTSLNLQAGPNRIRVVSNGLRSNLIVMDM